MCGIIVSCVAFESNQNHLSAASDLLTFFLHFDLEVAMIVANEHTLLGKLRRQVSTTQVFRLGLVRSACQASTPQVKQFSTVIYHGILCVAAKQQSDAPQV